MQGDTVINPLNKGILCVCGHKGEYHLVGVNRQAGKDTFIARGQCIHTTSNLMFIRNCGCKEFKAST
jgi:hypothetical protein